MLCLPRSRMLLWREVATEYFCILVLDQYMGQFTFSSNNSKQELKFQFMHFFVGIFPTFYFLLMTPEQYFRNHVCRLYLSQICSLNNPL